MTSQRPNLPGEPPPPQPPQPPPVPPPLSDFTWGHHMPGEVASVSEGWLVATSPTYHPAGPGECLIAGLHVFSGATAAVEWEAEAHRRADAGESRTGAVVPVTAPVLLSSRLINERLRGCVVNEIAEHRVVRSDAQSTLSGPSERLTCACGWEGHSTRCRDLDHGTDIPPLPPTTPPPAISRDELRRAIYGERRWRR